MEWTVQIVAHTPVWVSKFARYMARYLAVPATAAATP